MLNSILQLLPHIPQFHKRDCKIYNDLYVDMREYMYMLFHDTSYSLHPLAQPRKISFGSFFIRFPYLQMGNINIINLFNLDELINFSFYSHNIHRYKKVLDVGANIGVHSIILDKLGYKVIAIEPDLQHYKILIQNIVRNECKNIIPHECAMSNTNGTFKFIRVLDNTTSSHLEGSKQSYGPIITTDVQTKDIQEFNGQVDLIKLDIEGHEGTVLCKMSDDFFYNTDIIVEIHNEYNTHQIFQRCKNFTIQPQKIGWNDFRTIDDLPKCYKEGKCFISGKGNSFYG